MNPKAFLFTVLTFLASSIFVFAFFDLPRKFENRRDNVNAALVIRDNVDEAGKRITALYTLPYMDAYYGHFVYVEDADDTATVYTFVDTLNYLLANYDSVDIYILAHSNYYYTYFYSINPEKRSKIRMVYNSGCHNDEQAISWKDLGAKYYIGHQGELSLSPVFYIYYLRRMFEANDFKTAAEQANIYSRQRLKLYSFHPDTIAGSLGNYHSLCQK
jgi:hypothetical protein